MRPNRRRPMMVASAMAIAFLLLAAWPCAALDYTPTDLGVLPEYDHSEARDINEAGQVAGTSYNAIYHADWDWWEITSSRAFLWLPTGAYGLSAGMNDLGVLPGYENSKGFFINASGQVVGVCWKDGDQWESQRAFIWLPVSAFGLPAGMNDLGALLGHTSSTPFDINSAGQVIGESWLPMTDSHRGFIWQNGAIQEFTDLPAGANTIMPAAINDSGIVVGDARDNGSSVSGVIWSAATGTMVANLGSGIFPQVLNASGQVAGQILHWDERPIKWSAFLWLPDAAYGLPAGITDLGYPGLITDARAVGISTEGHILGNGYEQNEYGGTNPGEWMWRDGVFSVLKDDLGGAVTGMIDALAMSNSGQVAGTAFPPAPGTTSFFWNGTDPAQLLSPLGGNQSVVREVNDAGQVVGQSSLADGYSMHACLWGTAAVTNQKPTLTVPATEFAGVVGTETKFTATASDPDAGDTLTFSLVDAPTGAAIDPTTGLFAWTPTAAGSFTFDVKVTDAGGLYDSETVTVDVSALTVSKATIVRPGKNGKTFTVRVMIGNPDTKLAANVTVTTATLGGVATNSLLPQLFGTIKPGASKQCTLQFQGLIPGDATLTIRGTSSLGEFFTTQTVSVP